MMTSLWRYL